MLQLSRNGLRLQSLTSLDESQGSSNVKVSIQNDGTYTNYSTQLHYGYYVHGFSYTKGIARYENGVFILPREAFEQYGLLNLSVLLVSSDEELMTNQVQFIVKAAPRGDMVIDDIPSAQQQVLQLVQTTLDQYAHTINLNKNEIAVLKSRMDSFTSLQQGSTTGDAELIDGRVGYDGKTYENIGGAIRGQVSQLSDEIDEKADNLRDIIQCNVSNLMSNQVKVTGADFVNQNVSFETKNNSKIKLLEINGVSERVGNIKDMCINGTFESADGWGCGNGTILVKNNTLFATISNISDKLRITHALAKNAVVNHKYFIGFFAKLPKKTNFISCFVGGTTDIVPKEIFDFQFIGVETISNGTSINLNIYFDTRSNYDIGDVIEIKEVYVIDLTEAFGDGKEPSQEAMCKMVREKYIVDGETLADQTIRIYGNLFNSNLNFDFPYQTKITDFIISGNTSYNENGSKGISSPKTFKGVSTIYIDGVNIEIPTLYSLPNNVKDNYDVINKTGARKTKIVVFDGSEDWKLQTSQYDNSSRFGLTIPDMKPASSGVSYDSFLLSHFANAETYRNDYACADINTGKGLTIRIPNEELTEVSALGFKTWLANQYSNGTPVTIIYELSEYTVITDKIDDFRIGKSITNDNNAPMSCKYWIDELRIIKPLTLGSVLYLENGKYRINGQDISEYVTGSLYQYKNRTVEIDGIEINSITTQYVNTYKNKNYVVVSNDETIADFGEFTAGTKTGGIQEAIDFILKNGAQTGGTIYIKGVLKGTDTIVLPQCAYEPMMWLDDNDFLMQLRIIGDGPMCSQYILANADRSKDIMTSKAPITYSSLDLIIDGVGFAFEEETKEHRHGLNLYDVLQGEIRNVCVWGRDNSYGTGIVLPYVQKEQMILSRILISKFNLGYDVTGDWETLDRCETHKCTNGARILGGYGITFRDFHTIQIGKGGYGIYQDNTAPARNVKIYGYHCENPSIEAIACISGIPKNSNLTEREIYAENVRLTLNEIPISYGQVYVTNSGKKGIIEPPEIPNLNEKIENIFGDNVMVELNGGKGIHLIDIHDNDIELYDVQTIVLCHGESIYFSSESPKSWIWLTR